LEEPVTAGSGVCDAEQSMEHLTVWWWNDDVNQTGCPLHILCRYVDNVFFALDSNTKWISFLQI